MKSFSGEVFRAPPQQQAREACVEPGCAPKNSRYRMFAENALDCNFLGGQADLRVTTLLFRSHSTVCYQCWKAMLIGT